MFYGPGHANGIVEQACSCGSEFHQSGAVIGRIWFAADIAETFEFLNELPHALLGHAGSLREHGHAGAGSLEVGEQGDVRDSHVCITKFGQVTAGTRAEVTMGM